MPTPSRVKINRKKRQQGVKEVRVTTDQDEANHLLANGWELLHGGNAHVDGLGYNVKPTFTLGRVK